MLEPSNIWIILVSDPEDEDYAPNKTKVTRSSNRVGTIPSRNLRTLTVTKLLRIMFLYLRMANSPEVTLVLTNPCT